jgi:23S rRNA pseudouridine1911/1915/1917 synthase
LDKGTSGVLVVARNPEAHEGLARQFADHSAERRYLALVWGRLKEGRGTVDAALGRHPKDRLRFAVVAQGGRRAVTHYERLGEAAMGSRTVSFVSCRLETGRTHQIRVHLTHLGHSLLGDPLYGPGYPVAGAAGLDHQLLHAERLGFTHPRTGERLRFSSALPADFAGVLQGLGLGDCAQGSHRPRLGLAQVLVGQSGWHSISSTQAMGPAV